MKKLVLFDHVETLLTILGIGKKRLVWALSVSGVSMVKQFLFNKVYNVFLLPHRSATTAIPRKQLPAEQNATRTVLHCLIIQLQLIGHTFLRGEME